MRQSNASKFLNKLAVTKLEAYAKSILKENLLPKSSENLNDINRKINESKFRLINQTARQF